MQILLRLLVIFSRDGLTAERRASITVGCEYTTKQPNNEALLHAYKSALQMESMEQILGLFLFWS